MLRRPCSSRPRFRRSFRSPIAVAVVVATVLVAAVGCAAEPHRPSELAASLESSDSSWIGRSGIAIQFEVINSGGATDLIGIDTVGGLELLEASWSAEPRSAGPGVEPPTEVGLPTRIPEDSSGFVYLHWTVVNCAGLGTQEILDGDGGVLFSIDQVPLEVVISDPDTPSELVVGDGSRTVQFDPIHHPNQHVVALYELGECE